jgi:hypothetical protein
MLGGRPATITAVYRNHPVWKAIFAQFENYEGTFVPATIHIEGSDVDNVRGAKLESVKQFLRECIEGTKRMRSPFLVFLGVAPHTPMVWAPVGSRNLGTFTQF